MDFVTLSISGVLTVIVLIYSLPCVSWRVYLVFLYLQEYEEEHAKLVSVVTSMEQNIKALLKDFDSKKKVTRFCIFNDPFIPTE